LHAYPNPFNPLTNIGFTVHGSGVVTLKVFDVLGKEVATLANENLPAGSYTVQLNAEDLASGIYFVRLASGGRVLTMKLVVAK
jgi:hypothetical protein